MPHQKEEVATSSSRFLPGRNVASGLMHLLSFPGKPEFQTFM